MGNRQRVQWIEIDIPRCTRVYGQGLCGASIAAAQQRTNLALYSQAFDNAYWTKTASTLTSGFADPFGGTGAYRVFPTTANNVHRISSSISVTTGVTYTASAFMRAGVNLRGAIHIGNSDAAFPGALGHRIIVDLTTGAIVSQGGAITAAGAEDCGGGWWRVWASAVAQSSISALIAPVALASGVAHGFIGVVTDYIEAFGAQVEAGAGPSRYKATTAETVTGPYGGDVRKCYNTFATCSAKYAFVSSPQTVTMFPNVQGAPVGSLPCIDGAIRETEATVNIAGADPNLSAFGRRATMEFSVTDFRDNDTWFDRYWPERISGAAQTDEPGYDPAQRGTVMTKLKARWPHYAGRPCRVKDGWVEDGALTVDATRHYILTDFETDKRGHATFKARDVLDVAGNDRALAPKPCRGKLLYALAHDTTTATLTPAGIGDDDYDAAGRALIGSELVGFYRSGDTLTFWGRGLDGTVAASHAGLSTVQQTLHYDRVRADVIAADLLVNSGNVPAYYIPSIDWDTEMSIGAAGLYLSAHITKPEQVSKLIAELGLLGLSFYWDGDAQKVGLKTNRPIFDDVTWEITDDHIVRDGIGLKARDDRRLTEVLFQLVQIDPTKGLSDDNFAQLEYTIDGDAKAPDAYNDSRLKVESIRWLNQGSDYIARVLSLRYLKRFSTAPDHVMVTVRKEQFDGIKLTDVVFLTSSMRADATGKATRLSYEVVGKQGAGVGLVQLTLQRYFYEGKYGRIQANTASTTYAAANATERATGFYISDANGLMSDGSKAAVLA